MVTTLEVGILVLVLAVFFGAYRVLKVIRPFVVNAVVGLVVLLVASVLGLEVAITPLVLLVVAVGGLPGALLVVLLSVLGVAFVPALVLV